MHDAMVAALDGLLGELPAGFDRERTLREMTDLLQSMQDEKLRVVLEHLREMVRGGGMKKNLEAGGGAKEPARDRLKDHPCPARQGHTLPYGGTAWRRAPADATLLNLIGNSEKVASDTGPIAT